MVLTKDSTKDAELADSVKDAGLATIAESAMPPDVIWPPSDLYSDEPPLETDIHLRQILLLLSSLEWLWDDRNDFFASGNLTIYFSPDQIKSRDFRGPDFFVALDTERRTRKSWTIWDEGGKYPNVIFEILSSSTATVDRTTKKKLYQDIFRTPEYFWFDPDTLEFAGFILMGGKYEAISANENGYLWSTQLSLYVAVYNDKLRFFTEAGQLVLTPAEAAKEAQQAAAAAEQRNQKLAERLRALGIDPDSAD